MSVKPVFTPAANKTLSLVDMGIGDASKFNIVNELSDATKTVYSAVGTDDKRQYLVTFSTQHVTNFSSKLNLLNKPRSTEAQKSSVTIEWIKRVPADSYSPAFDQPQKAVFTYFNSDSSELTSAEFANVLVEIASALKYTDNSDVLPYLDKGSIVAAKNI
jgi:outer membrane protein OmpA-like peptidoglycan-associated protein